MTSSKDISKVSAREINMTFSILFRCLGGVVYLAMMSLVMGQVDSSSPPNALQASIPSQGYQSMLSTFLSSQQGLVQQMEALITQGATFDQIQSWEQLNAGLIQTQQQRAFALTAAAPVEPLAYITVIDVPDNATQEMSDFLVTQVDLFNRFVQLHNQRLQAGVLSPATSDEIVSFQQQNGAEIQVQQQRVQVVTAQSALQPLPVPPTLSIPAGSTPQMQAFLTLRDQLMREQIQLHNQSITASAADSSAALQQWQQLNASRFQRLQALAQNLSSATSTTQN